MNVKELLSRWSMKVDPLALLYAQRAMAVLLLFGCIVLGTLLLALKSELTLLSTIAWLGCTLALHCVLVIENLRKSDAELVDEPLRTKFIVGLMLLGAWILMVLGAPLVLGEDAERYEYAMYAILYWSAFMFSLWLGKYWRTSGRVTHTPEVDLEFTMPAFQIGR